MASQERVLKINKVISTTKSRVIHAQISIPKQYKMMMSTVARVKFINKGVSNQVSSNSDHEIKNYSRSNSTTKMGKNEKAGKKFPSYKTGQ